MASKSKYGGMIKNPRKIRSKMPYFLTHRSICASKKSEKQRKSAFRRTTRRKVIRTTPGNFVTSKSKYGCKGQNPRTIRTKVLLTLRAWVETRVFPFPGKTDGCESKYSAFRHARRRKALLTLFSCINFGTRFPEKSKSE